MRVDSRPVRRRKAFLEAFWELKRKFGGEDRKLIRSMARALAKNRARSKAA